MIIEFRKKGQITIPKEFVDALGLSEGDSLDIRMVDGTIRIEPVEIVAKKFAHRFETTSGVLKNAPDRYAEGLIRTPDETYPFVPDPEEKD